MPMYEFLCRKCQARFEQLTNSRDPDYGHCPKCGASAQDTERQLSTFAVGGPSSGTPQVPPCQSGSGGGCGGCPCAG